MLNYDGMQTMLDFETAGTSTLASVWELGAVSWNARDRLFTIEDTAKIHIPARFYGVTTDTFFEETTEEWAQNNASGYNKWRTMSVTVGDMSHVEWGMYLQHELIPDILHFQQHFIDNQTTIWAKGASFEFPKLKKLLTLAKLNYGKHTYRKEACIRSYTNLINYFGTGYPKHPDQAHDAKADALAQAECIHYILTTIRWMGQRNGIEQSIALTQGRINKEGGMKYASQT